jgi:hypothetical protein
VRAGPVFALAGVDMSCFASLVILVVYGDSFFSLFLLAYVVLIVDITDTSCIYQYAFIP